MSFAGMNNAPLSVEVDENSAISIRDPLDNDPDKMKKVISTAPWQCQLTPSFLLSNSHKILLWGDETRLKPYP